MSPRRARLSVKAVCLLGAVVGCKANAPMLGAPDAGTTGGPAAGQLAPPAVAAPEETPAANVPVRGVAPGTSLVVVQTGGATNVVGRVLPDGTFCVDVPLVEGDNKLRVVTLDHGLMSAATELRVVRDSATATPAAAPCAPPPNAARSCTDPQSMCDPACNGCKEDAYQPNFLANQAPALNMKTTYSGLQLCPCRADWFTFVAHSGQMVGLSVTYAKTAGFDLDIAIFRGADVLPMMSGAAPVAGSTAGMSGANATRTISFTAPSGGAYYLRIAGPAGSSGVGSYTLTAQ